MSTPVTFEGTELVEAEPGFYRLPGRGGIHDPGWARTDGKWWMLGDSDSGQRPGDTPETAQETCHMYWCGTCQQWYPHVLERFACEHLAWCNACDGWHLRGGGCEWSGVWCEPCGSYRDPDDPLGCWCRPGGDGAGGTP